MYKYICYLMRTISDFEQEYIIYTRLYEVTKQRKTD